MSVRTDLAWLDEWMAQNTPGMLSVLRAPATDAEVSALENGVGRRLQPDLVELLRWHNGSEQTLEGFQLWPSFYFVDTVGILREWNSRNELEQDAPSGDEWSSQWIPIATDWGGGNVVVDHSPGDGNGSTFMASLDAGPQRLAVTPGAVRGLSDLIGAIMFSLRDGSVSFDSYIPRPVAGHIAWIAETDL